ncbi:regulator of protease activity HflC (stomatin/prohibitin superfamily) [Thalassospira sp. MBR-102]|jgi:regulator of protease activity HflC (stomatin/prohibitin superfamily)|uniref:SPFH domain-containing protein n=1 Tax=Thalassospira TaxID=168934 RepID=UPI0008DCCEC9|nr:MULTISPECIES: SPFH domain-containing protein [Thalassospira]MAB33349.1 paraslipin [Thalassospira sp.]MDM7978083.1 SPFH domain-containing protein [Thalassospira xiamenensis]OHY98816.1 paraslipin [Thalassospira sp. MIT1004]HBS23220.1 SPFH/Band 7/PHB domain protein [Thalassospira sp.]|eukprot:NODE_884_length_1580_cov_1.238128_g873_i0.p1 GENE.NODE_884_length_1580_cov_1.238128_g873_i0~~NODE_884_length_1580_cov_1.238128_g873_i0.p1  ORF type:complete len:309 (+),score=41.73 NODE_884_length_1580_cov_1.238128_g873_i0:385-1311(+)
MHSTFAIFSVAFVFLAVVLTFLSVKIVPQGYEITVERLGRYLRTLDPGMHILIPVFDRVGQRMSLMERVLDIPSQEVISRDNASVVVDGVVFIRVTNTKDAAYKVERLDYAVQNLAMTNLRSVLGSMELDEMLSNREKISLLLLAVLDEATSDWGVKITRVEIKDVQPPEDLTEAMNRQMKAEREKRALILEADGEREANIKRAEGEKSAAILAAEGRMAAAELDARARERTAEAEAKATETVSKAIREGDVQAINYFVAQKYVESLGQIASSPNSKLVFMPLDASGVVGSIGGVTELIKTISQTNKS